MRCSKEIMEVAKKVCGGTNRYSKQKTSGWWNEQVAEAIEEKGFFISDGKTSTGDLSNSIGSKRKGNNCKRGKDSCHKKKDFEEFLKWLNKQGNTK